MTYNPAKELRDAARALRYYDRERLTTIMQQAAEEIDRLEKRNAELSAGTRAAARAVKRRGRWRAEP
jgi:hypothetical protein